jgi:hypothetical protein
MNQVLKRFEIPAHLDDNLFLYQLRCKKTNNCWFGLSCDPVNRCNTLGCQYELVAVVPATLRFDDKQALPATTETVIPFKQFA